jgi:hypothetical protein
MTTEQGLNDQDFLYHCVKGEGDLIKDEREKSLLCCEDERVIEVTRQDWKDFEAMFDGRY